MANKVYTQVPIVVADILEVLIGRDFVVRCAYQPKLQDGSDFGSVKRVDVPLSGGQITTLVNFLNANVVPAANTAEGT
jgi:hypothetical protein